MEDHFLQAAAVQQQAHLNIPPLRLGYVTLFRRSKMFLFCTKKMVEFYIAKYLKNSQQFRVLSMHWVGKMNLQIFSFNNNFFNVFF